MYGDTYVSISVQSPFRTLFLWAVFGRPFYPMLESPVASRYGIDPSQENDSKHASYVALYD